MATTILPAFLAYGCFECAYNDKNKQKLTVEFGPGTFQAVVIEWCQDIQQVELLHKDVLGQLASFVTRTTGAHLPIRVSSHASNDCFNRKVSGASASSVEKKTCFKCENFGIYRCIQMETIDTCWRTFHTVNAYPPNRSKRSFDNAF